MDLNHNFQHVAHERKLVCVDMCAWVSVNVYVSLHVFCIPVYVGVGGCGFPVIFFLFHYCLTFVRHLMLVPV